MERGLRTKGSSGQPKRAAILSRVPSWSGQWAALCVVAEALNGLESGALNGPRREAWQRVRDEILQHLAPALFPRPSARPTLLTRGWTTPDLRWAAGAFNRLSRASGLRLALGKGAHATAQWGNDALGEPLWMLWRYGFDRGGWERLKRCERCRRWFVDTMKNKMGRWCSRSCYDKIWNRPGRREFRRQRLRARRPRRGGPRKLDPRTIASLAQR